MPMEWRGNVECDGGAGVVAVSWWGRLSGELPEVVVGAVVGGLDDGGAVRGGRAGHPEHQVAVPVADLDEPVAGVGELPQVVVGAVVVPLDDLRAGGG